MSEADKVAFGLAMVALENEYGTEIAPVLDRYFRALRDLSLAEVVRGIAAHLRFSKWFPKPSEIRNAALGSPEQRATLAWLRLQRASEVIGTSETVTFADPTLHETLHRMGGWATADGWLDGHPRAVEMRRRDFERLYTFFLEHPPAKPPRLLFGSHEVRNRKNRVAFQPRCVRVGDDGSADGELARRAVAGPKMLTAGTGAPGLVTRDQVHALVVNLAERKSQWERERNAKRHASHGEAWWARLKETGDLPTAEWEQAYRVAHGTAP